MITPGTLSVFRFCETRTDSVTGQVALTDPVPFTFVERADTIKHPVVEGDTWESIAAMYYQALVGAPQLWRIIAEFQPTIPMDATIPPAPGSTVYVPSLRTVLEEIFNEARRADYEA